MSKDPRQYKYRVTETWGPVIDQIYVGAVIVDTDHGQEHDWTVYNLDTMEPKYGWSGVFIGMVDES